MVDWKKGILSTAIAIVFVFFVFQAISTFLDEPEWDDFCSREQYPRAFPEKLITDTSICQETLAANADIENQCADSKGMVIYEKDENGCDKAIECSDCNITYETARDAYQKKVFIITLIIGLIAIIGGTAAKVNALGTGLMGGGLLLIIFGTLQYWDGLQDYAQLIILGIVLAILIFIAHKKFTK
ncbi:MAG: hypothetical protein QF632_01560 [Candidatus Woesearchaeota archaeon]|jgi:hypothetical protein|nr:hypothetical protein [Candidatus Woesearchaeota archaeon]MDP7457174.1 hypothetical protein [Candidatus Woesearchaeota archaeon]